MSDVLRERASRIVLSSAASTWRIVELVPDDCADVLSGRSTAVIAFWHFQMLPLWYHLRTLAPAAVVSPSRDGSILAGWLGALRYGAVLRGSSSRGGSAVLAAAVDELRQRSVLMTPDGPRGPAREAKPGAIVAALRAGVPLVVAGWRSERVFRFGSWDRMEVPAPFARVEVSFARYELGGLTGEGRVSKAELRRLAAAIDDVAG